MLAAAAGAACLAPHVFAVNQSLCHLFDRICIRAGIATEETVKKKDKNGKEYVKTVIRKTDELGRKVTAHSFRHTFATKAAKQAKYDPHLLKSILGHHQLSTTDRYIHTRSAAEVVEVAELLACLPQNDGGVGVRGGGQKEASGVPEAS